MRLRNSDKVKKLTGATTRARSPDCTLKGKFPAPDFPEPFPGSDLRRYRERTLQVLEDGSVSGRTDVKIGALDSVPKRLLSSLVRAALKEKNVTVSLLEGRGEELSRKLFAHQLDLIVSNYPPASLEFGRIYSRSLAKVPVAIFASAEFAGLKKKFPESLNGQPFILPKARSRLRHDLDHYFKVNGLRIIPIVETQDTSLQKLLGIDGFGLVPLPEFTAKDLIGEKKLVKLGFLHGVREEFWLISAARKIEKPVAARLMKSFQFDHL